MSNHTAEFYKLIQKDKDLTKLLNDTEKNYTLFVPFNRAFFGRPHSPYTKPNFSESTSHYIATYHILEGIHTSKDVISHVTLPTILKESELGEDKQQRLRFSSLLGFKPKVNIISSIIATDYFGTNGVIHVVNHILLPPPKAIALLDLFPSTFSTSRVALYQTGIGNEIDDLTGSGLTLFAPTNKAWQRIPWDIRTFLFSHHGEKYLKALMRYHVSPKNILFSDSFSRGGDDDKTDAENQSHFHTDIPTLLEDKKIAVDVFRKGPHGSFVKWKINGESRLALTDIPTKDGALHVAYRVLVPFKTKPHGSRHPNALDGHSKLTVEEFVKRMDETLLSK